MITFLGPVKADIFIKKDVRDTDMIAMLLDVWLNGYSQRLWDGIARGRYRNGMEAGRLLDNGKVNNFKVGMWNTWHRFLQGHGIRVDISSFAFPKYSRNLNTRMDLASDSMMIVANTEVRHTKDYPSGISFPIYDRRT